MSGDHGHEKIYDPEKGFHPSCVTDLSRPMFDEDWQRRAFGLAVALSEFGHYRWEAFQKELIGAIGSWQDAPDDSRGRWEYYEHWVAALGAIVRENGLLEDGYLMPEDRDDGESGPLKRPLRPHVESISVMGLPLAVSPHLNPHRHDVTGPLGLFPLTDSSGASTGWLRYMPAL